MTQISEDAPRALAKGLTEQIVPSLAMLDERLSKFESQQQELLDSLQKASDSSLTELDLTNIKETMQKVSTYRDKLLYISATMKSLDIRSRQLKDKASQLHTARVNYDAQAASARQRNQEHDMAVAAKVVVPSNALAPSISIAPSPTIPANESPRSSSPIAESSLPSTVATTPQTEDLSQPDTAYVSSQTQVKKKKKARPKKREAIIDEGPIKRPTSSPDQSRGLRPPQ